MTAHTDTTAALSHVAREIRRQPDAWTRAVELAPEVAGMLPHSGERVAVIGCGTSWFMAGAYAWLRERGGSGVTDCYAAGDFPPRRDYDRVVAISRSGTTTEVVAAVEASAAPVTALTAVPDCPLTASAEASIVLDFADEQSVVQTVFATTTLMLLRATLGEQLDAVIAQGGQALDAYPALDDAVARSEQFTFLGQGWTFGIAQEAALKMREAGQLWTEAYQQMEYRHGPISIAQPGRAVWLFGTPVPGIVGDIRATGASLVDDDVDPVADLVRAQLIAVARAEAQGLDPDRPRGLTRSVVLG